METDVTGWFTTDNGVHVPIKNHESKEEALNGFFRFGTSPKSGKSVNHMTDGEENGVSVFTMKNGEFEVNSVREANTLTTFFNESRSRPFYKVEGEDTGEKGQDGETLLKNTKDTPQNIDIYKARDDFEEYLKSKFKTVYVQPGEYKEQVYDVFSDSGEMWHESRGKSPFEKHERLERYDEGYPLTERQQAEDALGLKQGDVYFSYGQTYYKDPIEGFDARDQIEYMRDQRKKQQNG